MPSTTHTEYNAHTEGLEVAKAFADGIRGKTILITGANLKGLAFTTAQAFASQSPSHLILAGRNQAKVQEVVDTLKAEFPNVDYRILLVDLSSQKSVRAAAAEVLSWSDIPAINTIVNSAAVMGTQELSHTEDGIELHLGTNHIGHFLLTALLVPKLIKAAEGGPRGATRVVNVSSGSPTVAAMRWSDRSFAKKSKDLPEEERPNYKMMEIWGHKDAANMSYIPIEAYNQSKVANILFGIALTERLYEKHGIFSTGLHPGVIHTELGRSFPQETIDALSGRNRDSTIFSYKSQRAGCSTALVAALDPLLGPGETQDGKENYGAFLSDCQISSNATERAVSSEQAEKLWKLSEELVNEKFAW